MIRLVALFGTGDVYLVCTLFEAFKQQHGEAKLVVKSHDVSVVDLFGLPYVVDDELVLRAEQDHEFQRTYENSLNGDIFYVHPSFLCSGAHLEQLTARWTASQADMYRCLLGLRTDAPLARPTNLPAAQMEPNTVLVLPMAKSWPNDQNTFWLELFLQLSLGGRKASWVDPDWSLSELFLRCAASEWVIGPQCGVMSILAAAGFPCRKSICTPSIDGNDHPGHLGWAIDTYPYAYVTKFTGNDYDVEEYKITDDNHAEVVGSILGGVNALRLRPVSPLPVLSVEAPLSPGDFLDRLAVLTVKRARFPFEKRALIEREYQRYGEIYRQMELPGKIQASMHRKLVELIDLHDETFNLLENLVPIVFADCTVHGDHHVKVIRLNRLRIELKQQIDALCNAPYTEVKSYYE